jgi:acyl-CoA reductase-like NAD-dependent aldehyde dehydrogenase
MQHRMYVDGAWIAARTGATTVATSPATGTELGTIPDGDRADARAAIAAARRAAAYWARLSAFDRAALLHRVADVIETRRDALARTLTLDQGKPLRTEAYDEVAELVTYWRMAAEDAKRLGGLLPNSSATGKRALLIRRPRGVVGVITPWNWPYTMPAELIAPALASGNTVVWTPAPSTAVSAVALAGCLAEADLPPGVVNLVTGPGPVVGDEIARNPGTDAVAFIGSTTTGRLVASAAAGKATLLEMGGNGPLVVLADAELDRAVDGALVVGSLDEAIRLTNASRYGLLAAVYTADLSTGLAFADAVRTGWVNINESTNYWESHLPFGGRAGSDSGLGRVGGAHPMEAFTELQTVIIG